jgi:hypothetical protein
VFENRVLRVIFGAKRDEVTGEWIKLYNEELNDLHCTPNIVRLIKSRRMIWMGRVARTGRGKTYTAFGWGNQRERDRLGDQARGGYKILNGFSVSGTLNYKMNRAG